LDRRVLLEIAVPEASVRVKGGRVEPGWMALEGSKVETKSDLALMIGPVTEAGAFLKLALTASSWAARDMVAGLFWVVI